MNRRTKFINKQSKIKRLIYSHIENNIKIYFIVSILLVLGIVIGIILCNKISTQEKEPIEAYINSYITNIKQENKIDSYTLLISSLLKNIFVLFIIWFSGLTFLGSILLYLEVTGIGISLGYTISIIMYSLGIGKGIIFIFSTMLLQNIIFIPTIIFFIVCGIKMQKDIVQGVLKFSKAKVLAKYTSLAILILCVLIISSFIEAYLSKNILLFLIKYL